MSICQYDDLRTIEHSTLKVPYEVLNKQYRNMQKSIDRDCASLSQCVLAVDKLAKSATESGPSRQELISSFQGLVDKLRVIKRRSVEFKHEENASIGQIRKRIEHLKQHECCSQDQLVVKSFKRMRVERMLVDYFLRQGLYETAQMLASKSNIEVRNLKINTFKHKSY